MFKHYDSFDLANALYHWLQHNWSGMNDLYKDFCLLTEPGMYKPGISEELYDNATDEVLEIYNELTLNNYKEALDQVLNHASE